MGFSSPFLLCGSQVLKSGESRLGDKCLLLLSHLNSPFKNIFIFSYMREANTVKRKKQEKKWNILSKRNGQL